MADLPKPPGSAAVEAAKTASAPGTGKTETKSRVQEMAQKLSESRAERLKKRDELAETPAVLGQNAMAVGAARFASNVERELTDVFGSKIGAALREARRAEPGKKLSTFGGAYLRQLTSTIGGMGIIGEGIANRLRDQRTFDKDPQKEFEREKGNFLAVSNDLKQAQLNFEKLKKGQEELTKVTKDVADKVEKINGTATKLKEEFYEFQNVNFRQFRDNVETRLSKLEGMAEMRSATGFAGQQMKTGRGGTSAGGGPSLTDIALTAAGTAAAGGVAAKALGYAKTAGKFALKRSPYLLAGYGLYKGIETIGQANEARDKELGIDRNDPRMLTPEGQAEIEQKRREYHGRRKRGVNEEYRAQLEEAKKQEATQQKTNTPTSQKTGGPLAGKGGFAGFGGFPSTTRPSPSSSIQQYAQRFKKESSFGESFDRQMIEREKSQFLQFGQLPRGFEFLPGHMGRLGQPEAVAARGAMPLGGYGGVAGVPGMPSGGYSTGGGNAAGYTTGPTANVGREGTYAGSRSRTIEPGIDIPSTPGKFGLTTSTRDQLQLGREPGRRDISLDFNSVGLKSKASGALIVVPDNASPEEITSAKQYLKGLQELMEKHGHKGYSLLGGGVHGPGIKTTSENRRGVPGVFHTEGWFAGDQKAVDIMSLPEAQQEYASLLSRTLGNISGARFIPPHIAGGNEGATKNIKTGSGREAISETEFARRHILPRLQQIRENMDKGGGPQPTAATTSGLSTQSADELKKQFNLDFRQNKFAREKNLGAVFGNAPGAPGGTTGLKGREHLLKYDPEVINKANARGQFQIVTHKTMEEGAAATLSHYLNGKYVGKTLQEANSIWTGGHPYLSAMREVGLDPKMKITKESLSNPEIAEKLIRMHLIGEASVRQGSSPIDIPSENLRRAHQYFMLKEGLSVSPASTGIAPTPGATPTAPGTQPQAPGTQVPGTQVPGVTPTAPESLSRYTASQLQQIKDGTFPRMEGVTPEQAQQELDKRKAQILRENQRDPNTPATWEPNSNSIRVDGALLTAKPPPTGATPVIPSGTGPGTMEGVLRRGAQIGNISGGIIGENTGRGLCGRGTRGLAGALLNQPYFSTGISAGGSGYAGSLAINNRYFENSGFYNPLQRVDKSKILDKKWLDSLPIGTVIASGTDNPSARNPGHVQIKIGPGKWASGNLQGNTVRTSGTGGSHTNFSVSIPNAKGFQAMNPAIIAGDPATMAAMQAAGMNIPAPTTEEQRQFQQQTGVRGVFVSNETINQVAQQFGISPEQLKSDLQNRPAEIQRLAQQYGLEPSKLEQLYAKAFGKETLEQQQARLQQQELPSLQPPSTNAEALQRQNEALAAAGITPEGSTVRPEFRNLPEGQNVTPTETPPEITPMPSEQNPLPSVSPGTTSAAQAAPEAAGTVDIPVPQPSTPTSSDADRLTPEGIARARAAEPVESTPATPPVPSPAEASAAAAGRPYEPSPAPSAPSPRQAEDESMAALGRARAEQAAVERGTPTTATSPNQNSTGGQGRSSSGGQPQKFDPESAPPSPGTGGSGSYGRCFVIYEWR